MLGEDFGKETQDNSPDCPEIKSLKSKQNAENNHGHKLTNLNPHPLTQHQNIAKHE